MKCGFCGYEFPEEEGIRGCGKCGMAQGCRMIHCPRCNYENPPEPAVVKKLRKMMGKKM